MKGQGVKILAFLAALGGGTLLLAGEARTGPLRVGIIGLDTSHVVDFTHVLNNPKNDGDLAGLRVVAAYPGGSRDIPRSHERVPGFTKQLKEAGVEIVDSVEDLVSRVDVVLLESLDGRVHLEQARPVLKAGKKMFIDKPVAASLADVVRLYRLAQECKTPIFSSSALRYSKGIAAARRNPKIGDVLGCVAYSPCLLEEHHPDLFWYGIHGVEALYAVMGPGCESVTWAGAKDSIVATGTWKDGRIGTFRGLRSGKLDYGALVFGSVGITDTGSFTGYEPLVVEIARFFKTGRPPVSAEETIELYAFMEAAHESKRQGGVPVRLSSVLEKANATAAR